MLTEWDEFKTYDSKKIKDEMKKPAFVFDGRK
nr:MULTISPECIES: UDP binding domain-containing protein [unclassified Sphingobacterium]